MKTEQDLEVDENLVVCGLVGEQAIPNVKGSQIRSCSSCEEDLWVSPSTFMQLASVPDHKFICMPCFAKHREKHGDIESITTVMPNEAALEELKKAGINISAERLFALSEFLSNNPAVVERMMNEDKNS